MVKSCKICGSNENGFQRDSSKSDGLRTECKSCSKKLDADRRKKNPDAYKQKAKNSYLKHRESRIKQVSKYYQSIGKQKGSKRIHNRIQKLITLLGGKCIECGREDHLSIDHINNNGGDDRKLGSKDMMIRKILKNPKERSSYQILCHNCNQKKQINRIRKEILDQSKNGKYKYCPTCNNDVDTAYFHHHPAYKDNIYYECTFCVSERRKEIKIRVINLLGGQCKECGILDTDVLCVDHISPIGHNRTIHGYVLYNRILSGIYEQKLFQVLCFNCNQKKGPKISERLTRTETNYWSDSPKIQETTTEELIEYDLSDIKVGRITSKESSMFLDKYHYDGYGRHAKRCYVAKLNEEIIAIAKICSVTRQGTPGSLGLMKEQVLELDRLCASPKRRKKNLMSWFLSRVVKFIREDYPEIEAIVSFADTEEGHDGATYKASNWIESGKTSPSYYYLDNDGKKIKKKTFFDWIKIRGLKIDKTESEVAKNLGFTKIRTAPKIRFIFRYDIQAHSKPRVLRREPANSNFP